MTQPTFFTITADYRSVLADTEIDLDSDPQIGFISALATFKPVLRDGDAILAINATPRPTAYVPAPVVAKLDTDGRLKLRSDPDGVRVNVANFPALPTTGDPTRYYVVASTGKFYRWTGSAYAEILPYQPVRLLANSELLQLASPLFYTVIFSQVIFNGRAGKLNSFSFQAPSSDVTLNLIEVMRQPGQPPTGITRITPTGVRQLTDTSFVFTNGGIDIPEPIDIGDSLVSDFDDRLDDTRIPTDGSVGVDKLTDTLAGRISGIRNSGVTDDNANKSGLYGVEHYDVDAKPVVGVSLAAEENSSTVRLGGGTVDGNAATVVAFYTGSNTTSGVGTLRGQFGTDGTFNWRSDARFGLGTGPGVNMILDSAAGNHRSVIFASNGNSRWHIRANNTAESGASAGSNFDIVAFDDSGTETTAFTIDRANFTATCFGTLVTPASTSSHPSARLPHGSAPSSPVDGDVWTTSGGLFVRLNGVTCQFVHSADDKIALASRIAAPAVYTSGQYFFCNSQNNSATGQTTNNSVRVSPWFVTETVTVSSLFCDYTVAGNASSVFRFGIWNDSSGKPGTLVLDDDYTVAVDGTPAVTEIVLSPTLTLAPGLYWVGGAVQGAATTQPTMRTVNANAILGAIPLGSSLPTGVTAGFGWLHANVTGAFGTFNASPSVTGLAPRIGFKVA
jgi:hypothetical protein